MATYEYLGVGQQDGTVVGRSATDKIGFFGTAPVVQNTTVVTLATGATHVSIALAVRAMLVRLKALGIFKT